MLCYITSSSNRVSEPVGSSAPVGAMAPVGTGGAGSFGGPSFYQEPVYVNPSTPTIIVAPPILPIVL